MEYMNAGNLAGVLRDDDWRVKLDLKERVKLATEIAGYDHYYYHRYHYHYINIKRRISIYS